MGGRLYPEHRAAEGGGDRTHTAALAAERYRFVTRPWNAPTEELFSKLRRCGRRPKAEAAGRAEGDDRRTEHTVLHPYPPHCKFDKHFLFFYLFFYFLT